MEAKANQPCACFQIELLEINTVVLSLRQSSVPVAQGVASEAASPRFSQALSVSLGTVFCPPRQIRFKCYHPRETHKDNRLHRPSCGGQGCADTTPCDHINYLLHPHKPNNLFSLGMIAGLTF